MWLSMSKDEIRALKKAIGLVGFTSTGADVPLARLRDKLDEALRDDKNPALRAYRKRAKERYKEGELEIDDDAVVSHGDDHGAYVMAWIWVEDEDEEEEDGVDDHVQDGI